MTNRRINSTLPAATLAQRLAQLSVQQLMIVAATLAPDRKQDLLVTKVLERLETQIPAAEFESFLASIF